MFEPVAFVKYDEAVRERANDKGLTQFGVIETDKVYSHFSLENTVKVMGKGPATQKGGRGTSRAVNKAKTHIRFNNYDIGCKGKCSYLHTCYVCDSKDHGKRDCPKKLGNKKEIDSKSGSGFSVTGFILKGKLFDNGDVIA